MPIGSDSSNCVGRTSRRTFDQIVENLTLHALDLQALARTHRRPFLRPGRDARCFQESLQLRDAFASVCQFFMVPYHDSTSSNPRFDPSRFSCKSQETPASTHPATCLAAPRIRLLRALARSALINTRALPYRPVGLDGKLRASPAVAGHASVGRRRQAGKWVKMPLAFVRKKSIFF